MLKLLLASIAVAASWFWMRDFFSRAIDGREKFSTKDFALRGGVFAVSLIWFVAAVFGVVGGLFGWLVVAAIVGISVKLLAGKLGLLGAEPPPADPEPPAES